MQTVSRCVHRCMYVIFIVSFFFFLNTRSVWNSTYPCSCTQWRYRWALRTPRRTAAPACRAGASSWSELPPGRTRATWCRASESWQPPWWCRSTCLTTETKKRLFKGISPEVRKWKFGRILIWKGDIHLSKKIWKYSNIKKIYENKSISNIQK